MELTQREEGSISTRRYRGWKYSSTEQREASRSTIWDPAGKSNDSGGGGVTPRLQRKRVLEVRGKSDTPEDSIRGMGQRAVSYPDEACKLIQDRQRQLEAESNENVQEKET